MANINPQILERINAWLSPSFDSETHNQIKTKITANPEDLEENEISVSEKTKTKIEPQKVIDLFHQFCPDLPQVQVLNKSRKSVINGRLNEQGLNKITEVFQLAGESNFLNGVNSKNWNATFDWILKPINFAKILEGNFKNKNNGGNTQNFVSNR